MHGVPLEPEDRADQELMQKAQGGDKSAFEALHKKYKGPIVSYVYRFFGNHHIAEDITQETFIHVYKNLKSYRPIGKVSSWIYRIATNLSKNRLKRLKKKKAVALDAPVSDEDKTPFIELLDSKMASPEEIARSHELEREVQRAILTLPPKSRAALILCEIQGLSHQEAAKILNCSTHTLVMRLGRARAQMEKKIKWDSFI